MFTLWIAIIWAFLGVVFISIMDNNNTGNTSVKKAVVLILVSGPGMWIYSLYRYLR